MNNKSLLIIGALLLTLLASCTKSEPRVDQLRSEYIKVYETTEDKNVSSIQIPFEGAKDAQIHVLSNVPLEWKYFISQWQANTTWLTIKNVSEVAEGHYVVTYDAESLVELNSLDRRESHLSFTNSSISLGKFIPLRQGYPNKFSETFDGEQDGVLTLTGMQTFTTDEYPSFNTDYFDYIAFNAWATTDNDILSKNITLDVKIDGGAFYDTGLKTFRINIPIGDKPDASNYKYFLIYNNMERLSANTKFTFSVANDEDVFVHIDNFSAYKVAEAEVLDIFDDIDIEIEEDWI